MNNSQQHISVQSPVNALLVCPQCSFVPHEVIILYLKIGEKIHKSISPFSSKVHIPWNPNWAPTRGGKVTK